MTIAIRQANGADAAAMARLLNAIIARGGSTAPRDPFDASRITATFLESPRKIACICAAERETVLGFQVLEWSDPDWPETDRRPADWAFIGTYVALDRHGQGIGRRLLAATLEAARNAGVRHIDATIRRENVAGLAYYARMGFTEDRAGPESLSKRLSL